MLKNTLTRKEPPWICLHVSLGFSAASPKGKEFVYSKIAPKWGRGPPKRPHFFLPAQPLFWQGWENRVFIYGAVCCGFPTITEWQCLDWEACWRFMEGDMRGPALPRLLQPDVWIQIPRFHAWISLKCLSSGVSKTCKQTHFTKPQTLSYIRLLTLMHLKYMNRMFPSWAYRPL